MNEKVKQSCFGKRVNLEEVKTMKSLKKKGLTFKKIGDLLGFNETTISYHLNDKIRKRRRLCANTSWKKKYHSDPAFHKICRQRAKKWCKENSDCFSRIRLFSDLKRCLNKRIVSIEEIRKTLIEYKKEGKKYEF